MENGIPRRDDFSRIVQLEQSLIDALALVEQLQGERKAIQEDERTVTCVFCGHAYPPGTPASNHEMLVEHVRLCAEHPIGIENRQLRSALTELLQQAAHNCTCFLFSTQKYGVRAIERARAALALDGEG